MNKIKWIQQRLWFLSIPLAIGLVWIVVKEIGWSGLSQAIHKFSISTWIVMIIFMMGSLSSQIIRSWVLLKSNAPTLRLRDVAKAGLGAFTVGSLTPGRIGDAAIVLLLPATTGRTVGISLVDRLMYWPPMHLFGLFSFGVLLIPYLGWWSFTVSIFLCFVYLLTYEWIFYRTRNKPTNIEEHRFWHQLYEGFTLIPHKTLRIGVLLGFVQYTIVAFQFVYSLTAVGWQGSFFTGLFVFGALQLVRSFLAVTPGNLGTSEFVGMVLGHLLFQSKDLLPQVTISLFLVNTILPGILGLPLWIGLSRQLKSK